MGADSKISWTDHTFSPWWGCLEASPACDHCYARMLAKRWGFDIWGEDHTLREFGDKHWNEPLRWNADALKTLGRPARVFCASMADVFEVHPRAEELRPRLLALIEQTPNLQWLLLTKRALEIKRHKDTFLRQPNVLMGVTVENQTYDWRISPPVQWISAEPLLGPLDLRAFPFLKWTIIGGESGAHSRPMEERWARDLMAQCRDLGIAVHFKQTGDRLARTLGLKDRSGKNPDEWPEWMRVQEFPK